MMSKKEGDQRLAIQPISKDISFKTKETERERERAIIRGNGIKKRLFLGCILLH